MSKIITLNSNEDKDEDEVAYSIYHQQKTIDRYIVRLHANIGLPHQYGELFTLLETATEDDTIELDLNTVGGSLDTAILMRRAIKTSEAQVIGRVGPTCASAGGAIILACDTWLIDEASTLMVHTGSLGLGFGKANDIHAASTHNLKQIERFIRTTYAGFLTPEEILMVLEGKEYYFDAEELEERLNILVDFQEAESDKAQTTVKEFPEDVQDGDLIVVENQ